jgi:hypothetical protein
MRKLAAGGGRRGYKCPQYFFKIGIVYLASELNNDK